MEPVFEVVPGSGSTLEVVVFAKDQPEYKKLPGFRVKGHEGVVVTRWKLSWRERFQILFGGHLWLQLMTFWRPLQPVKLTTTCPITMDEVEGPAV